jgi:hypothetical protein
VAAGEGEHLLSDGANILTTEDHIVFHASPARSATTDFLDASPERVSAADVLPLRSGLDEQRGGLLDAIAAAGSGTYAVDVTPADVQGLGLRVVKTVAPGLCALDVPHPLRFLGARRLHSVPCGLGFGRRPLNPDPHPFP